MAEAKPDPKTVQELSENGVEPPQDYVWTSNIEVDVPFAAGIPVIDVSRLVSSSVDDVELVELRSALTTWGCFQVCLHVHLSIICRDIYQFFCCRQ